MTVGLAWLLTGCVTAPPLVAGRVAQITTYMMTEEEPDLIARAGAAVAEGRYAVAGAIVSDDANNIQRFAALKRILDAGLITQEEYGERREANLGVLLPLIRPAPTLDAERLPVLLKTPTVKLRAASP